MSAIACTRIVVVSMLLAIPASPLSAQNAGEALADRLRSFNQALDFAGGIAEARANPQGLRSPRARAWYTLLLARNGDGRAALAVADSLRAADRRSPWSSFARAAALGYGFSDSSDAALAASEELLRRAPRHPDAVQLRGATLVNSGRPIEALAVVDSFLVRNPNAVPHLVLRGNTTWAAAGAARPPNPARKDSAIALWARARALDSTDVLAWSAAGSRLQNDGQLAAALPLLRRASELAPLSLRVNRDYWRALRSQYSSDPERAKAEALPAIDRVLAARGNDPRVLLDLAAEYESFRMPDAQRALEDRILRENPTTASADWVLVNRFRAVTNAMRDTTVRDSSLKGTYLRLLQEFIARPTHADERLLGEAYMRLFGIADSTTPADTLLSIVLGMERFERLNPGTTFAMGAIALADRRVHLDQAERLARAGQQAGRRRVEAGRQVLEGLGEYARALDRMNATMVDALGWVHFQAGRAEDAERELRQALDLDPQNMSAFHHLGRLFEAARQPDSAESYYIRGAMVASPMTNPNRAALRALFVARRGSAEGYDQYYAGIRDLDRARRRATIATEIKTTRDRDTLPSFQLTALSGDTVRSSALAGRVTVINFWGTWCGPCVVEMPEVQRFWQSVARDTTVRFLTINNDQNLRDLREWLGQRRYDIPVLVDAGYAGRVGVNAFPTTWFVDRTGRIAFVKRGWSEALAEEFGWRVEMLKAETPSP